MQEIVSVCFQPLTSTMSLTYSEHLRRMIKCPSLSLVNLSPTLNYYFKVPDCDQGSTSSMFYKQLLHVKIPKAQKRQSSQQCCFALSGPTSLKAAHKTLAKLTPYKLSYLLTPFEVSIFSWHGICFSAKIFYQN